MDNQKLATAASGRTAITTTNSTAVLPERVRRVLENFLLIWLDANFDESKEHYKKSIQLLRHIVATITAFTDTDQCIDFLSDIRNEKVFMIVSGSLGQHIIPRIQALPQLHSIYVFCDNQSINEQWAKTIPKVKGVYTKIEPICQSLQIDCEHCDRGMISISFNGIDPLFMYTQLLKETFLEIDDDDHKSVKELVDYCRLQGDINANHIDKVEKEYRLHTPIWWYTAPYFIYSMLNRALRLMDVDIILKMGFFIRHLHQHIVYLHREQESTNMTKSTPFQVFRGQSLSIENFEKMKKTKGGLMSFNNFLSTSRQRNTSLENFAWPAALIDPNSVGILFVMTIDPILCAASSILFADASSDKERSDYNHQLGRVYYSIGEYLKALSAYERSLELKKLALPPNHPDLAASYNNIGAVYSNMGEYSRALLSYERSLEIKKIALPPNHPDLAASYNNIGAVYSNMGEYSKAFSSYERSLEIKKIALPPNHPDLAASYNNIGAVYSNMGEYSRALSSYERSLEIQKIALPPNHPDLAASYNNIGAVYSNMGEYSKALPSYERSLEIKKIALPPNHPDLAASYNNIGLVYTNMGEYSKALSSYERSLEIKRIALPPNHPDLAASYNNIGAVYYNMGEYSKALSSYERSLELQKIALPPKHPDLAASYNNIALVYNNMGQYSKALSSYERSLEIKKIALPPNHPDLAASYNNIGTVYDNLSEYPKALSSYERALEIQKIALPPNHLDLAASYNNI
ncbi:unnamed protein product, partial [Rotaria sordida]